MEGTCLCGAIKVRVDDDELYTKRRGHVCHCNNCRKVAGGVAGYNLLIETSKVTIVGEENLKVFSDPATLSGKPVQRYFCSTCGVPIKSMTPNFKDKTILKLGIFPKLPQPEFESFASNRLEWEAPLEGCTQFKIKLFGETL